MRRHAEAAKYRCVEKFSRVAVDGDSWEWLYLPDHGVMYLGDGPNASNWEMG